MFNNVLRWFSCFLHKVWLLLLFHLNKKESFFLFLCWFWELNVTKVFYPASNYSFRWEIDKKSFDAHTVRSIFLGTFTQSKKYREFSSVYRSLCITSAVDLLRRLISCWKFYRISFFILFQYFCNSFLFFWLNYDFFCLAWLSSFNYTQIQLESSESQKVNQLVLSRSIAVDYLSLAEQSFKV